MYFQDRLTPRNGVKLRVLIGARISGCVNQKEVSLDDQADHGKAIVGEMYGGDVDYTIISTKGKGERLDRPELAQIEAAFRTSTYDLAIFEDLGRLVRGPEAARLCGIAVDHGTRVLAPDDGIDTKDPDWEQDVLDACKEHVGHNCRVSKRLKHKLMNRFRKYGAARADLPFGFVLPEGGKTYFDAQKDPRPEIANLLQQGLELLRTSLNYSTVAQFFNLRGASGGNSRRKAEWTGSSIKRLFHNPILKGRPQRGTRISDKHHETGRRISVINPAGPIYIECDHLAYFASEDIDPVLAALNERNARHSRVRGGRDPRHRVPRKQTRFPGQFGTCWYCGSHFVWGGNGIKDHLMCARSREWKCWNSVGFSGPLFVERLTSAIFDRLEEVQGLDEQFRALVADANKLRSVDSELAKLQRDEDSLARERKNVIDAIAKYGPQDMFDERMAEVGRRTEIIKGTRHQLEAMTRRRLELPESPDALRIMMESAFRDLSSTSQEFALLLRKLVPEFHVYLVRPCDRGHPVPRIRVRLDLAGICPDARRIDGLGAILSSTVTLNVFDDPQRVRILQEAVELTEKGHNQRDACKLIAEAPSQPAFQNALKLHQKMQELGLTDPYVLLRTPPDDYAKLRRHKAVHFRFQPIEGYVPPDLT